MSGHLEGNLGVAFLFTMRYAFLEIFMPGLHGKLNSLLGAKKKAVISDCLWYNKYEKTLMAYIMPSIPPPPCGWG
jgi:hypothetical protein